MFKGDMTADGCMLILIVDRDLRVLQLEIWTLDFRPWTAVDGTSSTCRFASDRY